LIVISRGGSAYFAKSTVHFHTFSELPVNLPTANSHYLSVTFDNCMTRFTRDFQTFRIHRLFYKHPCIYVCI